MNLTSESVAPLGTRQKKLLRWIVQSYIDDAKPVGSKHLVERYRLNWSPATVRSEMVALEERGFVQQPHTSAGRIPTDTGYRFYVASLMKREALSGVEQDQIREKMENSGGNVSLVLEEASRILGRVSRELGIVLTPWISWGIFDRMELIRLAERKILAVIKVRSRLVKTVVIEIESDLADEDLERVSSVLNERLSGLTLEEIQRTIADRVKHAGQADPVMLRQVVDSAPQLFDFSEPLDVHTCGTQNIVSQPEFSDTNRLESILNLVDNKRQLIHLFHRKVDDTEVTIGCEHEDESLHDFSVITACYYRGKDVGTLGVIGPTRMRYGKIVSLIDFMADAMSSYLS